MLRESFSIIQYNNLTYPPEYTCAIQEVAAHFDKTPHSLPDSYSLHTEYSYGKRKFNSDIISDFPPLINSQRNGIPQLWKSSEWADAFAEFIIRFTAQSPAPRIIEIHPPFNDYCTIKQFSERYSIFEVKLHSHYPDAKIVIENRAGSLYRGGKFLFSTAEDISHLCTTIQKDHLHLGIVLDFPQLLTAERIDTLNFNHKKYNSAISLLVQHRIHIKGIHIWGKKKSPKNRWVAHCGDLDSYFGNHTLAKQIFIAGISEICNDGICRYLVPEVNSGEDDLHRILSDIFNK